MPGPIIYVGTHAIKDGSAEVAMQASRELARFLEANHPRYLHFEISVSPGGERMTVVQVHPDEESLQLHLELAGERIAQAYEFLEATTSIHIFGNPGEALSAKIQEMAMGAPVEIHRPDCGFSRLSS